MGHTGKINKIIISEDELYVITASSDNTIKIWDITSGKLLNTLTSHTD
jgi:WD40 repeat protein